MSSTSFIRVHDPLFARMFRLLANPSLVAAFIFATSGAAFALGNLLIARVIPVAAFGHFALSIALFNIIVLIAPLGIDQFVLRHRFNPSLSLAAGISTVAILLGSLAAIVTTRAIGRPTIEAIPLAFAIAAGSLIQLASTFFRAAGHKAQSLLLATWASWLLLAIGCAAQFLSLSSPVLPLVWFAFGNIVMAMGAWVVLLRNHRADAIVDQPILWRECFSLLSVAAVATFSLQLERMVIPSVLGVSELALFSVLASTVIYPFRLLVAGTNFTLIPRLRQMDGPAGRRLVRHEILLLSPIALVTVAIMVPIAPYLIAWLTAGTYRVGFGLVGAACMSGLAKLVQSFAASIVSGAGDSGAVHQLNSFSIVWIGAAASGAWLGSSYGLSGLLIGLSGAALLASVPSILLAWRSLK